MVASPRPSPSPSPTLVHFYEEVFLPLAGRKLGVVSRSQYRKAIQWFADGLRRAPLLSDLQRPLLEALFRALADVGLSPVRIQCIAKKLNTLWRYAARLGMSAPHEQPRLPKQRLCDRQGAADPAPAPGTLLAFYRATFRPALVANGLHRNSVNAYDRAVNSFCECAGNVLLDTVTREQVSEYGLWLLQRQFSDARQRVTALKRIVRAYDPERMPAFGGKPSAHLIANEGRAPRRRQVPELQGEPGTLIHFFQTVYRPEALLAATPETARNYQATFRHLRKCFGRDLRLDELSAANVSAFCEWLKNRGCALGGIKSHRLRVCALWRWARDQNLAPEVPRFRALRVPREQPDAWSLEEMARIIHEARRLEAPPIAGIPAADYLTAFLLVGYWTALRFGSLRAIVPANVDLEGGWLYLPANSMKNARGKRFRIGADAVAALRKIWDGQRATVFPAVCPKVIRKHFRAVLRAAGVPASRHSKGLLHKLRRTTITHTAVRAGLAAAIALAGHSGPYVTECYIDPTFLTGNDATEWLPSLTQLAQRQNLPPA